MATKLALKFLPLMAAVAFAIPSFSEAAGRRGCQANDVDALLYQFNTVNRQIQDARELGSLTTDPVYRQWARSIERQAQALLASIRRQLAACGVR